MLARRTRFWVLLTLMVITITSIVMVMLFYKPHQPALPHKVCETRVMERQYVEPILDNHILYNGDTQLNKVAVRPLLVGILLCLVWQDTVAHS